MARSKLWAVTDSASRSPPDRRGLLEQLSEARRRVEELESALRSGDGAPDVRQPDDATVAAVLLGHVPDFVYFKDAQRRFVRASASFEELLGRPLEEILGRRDEELFPIEIARETREDDERVLAGERIVNKSEGGETRPGVERWVLTTKLPWTDATGGICGLFGMSRDITEEKRLEDALRASEHRLRIISDTVPFPVAATRVADGTILYANQAFADFLGVPLDTLEGALVPNYYEDPAQRLAVVERVAREGRVDGAELRMRRPDGRVVISSSFIVPLTIDGEPALMGAGADITVLKQREAELEELTRQKEVLLREVNHRVRNNLATLLALVGQHQRRATNPAKALEKLAHFIRGLAAVHSMLSEVSWRPLSLSLLCERVVGSVFEGADVRPAVAVGASDATVSSHFAHQLALVVGELAANSLKHAASDGGLDVSIVIDASARELVVAYRDNGPGFPEHVLTSQSGGFGFQLVEGLVESTLGGRWSLSNDGGAVTMLHLPRARADETAERR